VKIIYVYHSLGTTDSRERKVVSFFLLKKKKKKIKTKKKRKRKRKEKKNEMNKYLKMKLRLKKNTIVIIMKILYFMILNQKYSFFIF